MARIAVVLAGTAALAAGTSAPAGAAPFAAPETTEVFVGGPQTPSAAPVRALAHRFLLVGAEEVTRDGAALLPETDYRLDPDAGTIRLARPLAPGETVAVRYAWIPIELPRDFVALERGEPTPADSVVMSEPVEAGVSTADRLGRAIGEDLAVRGAKTVSIEVGTNRDAAVEQSLRVSVTGRIGENVRLTALLSDQNIPLQPEGNTTRLEELDEVLIKVEGPRASATLGEFVARREGSAFGSFERRLSGAEAEVRPGAGEVRGIGASTRGEFRTVEFRGEEGKQGPYLLAGEGSNVTGVIVAGSERVWLDGRELTRGDSRDYVMDYSRGELEFTNRVLVTQDSEIAVDFEVAEQEYKRSFVMGEGGWSSDGDGFRMRTAIVSEIDGHDPVNVALDDARRAALEAAGTGRVMVPGAVCGVENGDYDDAGDHFEWAGADSGTCDVSFTFVGDGQGSYARDRDLDTALTFFRYVGVGQGAYVDSLLLAAPRTRTLADVEMRARAGTLTFDVDGAATRDDRNTLSSRGVGDIDGTAARAALAWTSGAFAHARSPVKVEARTTFRGESAKFAPIGRTRDAYLGEVWNFADTTRADEVTGEASARVFAADRWEVGGAFGVLERTGRFRSERREGSAGWSSRYLPTARLRVENVRREDEQSEAGVVHGRLDRQTAVLGGALAWLRPGVSWTREDREDTRGGESLSGKDDREIAGTLAVQAGRDVSATARVAHRTIDLVDAGDWVRDSVARTVELGAEATPGRSLRTRVSWIRRRLDYEEARGTPDVTTNLARADLAHESFDGLVEGEYVYETTSRTFADFAEGPGAAEEPTLAIDASARLRVGGRGRASGRDEAEPAWRLWLARFRAESLFRVEEETRAQDRGPIYRLDLSRFRNAQDTVFGKMLLRQELTLFPGARAFSVTGRWERIDTRDNRVASRSTDIRSERRVLRARNRLTREWSLETQGTWQDDARGDELLSTREFDVRLLELREDLVWQATPTRRVSGRGALVSERNDVNDASIRGLLLGWIVDSAIAGQGRLRAETTWTHPTSVDGVDTVNRFRTKDGDQLEWRGTLEVRLSDSVNASISYSGRRLEGTSTRHIARAEARALF